MNKRLLLNEITSEITSCQICPMGKHGLPVVGEGNPDADIVFIGEAPGKQEAESGRPFVGRSGKFLRSQIHELGLDDTKDVYITSPVKYLPNRGTPTSEDITHGRIHLMKQLAIIQPKIVVLLGRVAAEGVLQTKLSVMKEHGKVIGGTGGIRYFLTLHPAAAIRFQKFKSLLLQDFQSLKKLLNK